MASLKKQIFPSDGSSVSPKSSSHDGKHLSDNFCSDYDHENSDDSNRYHFSDHDGKHLSNDYSDKRDTSSLYNYITNLY